MANAKYAKYTQACLEGASPNLDTGTVKATLVDLADYTPDLAAHEFITDVPAGARVATATLANTVTTGGVFDADNVTFPTVTGDPSEALVLWHDTGTPATSRLIAYFDTATGLPVTPNGGNIDITWDNGANKIFAL